VQKKKHRKYAQRRSTLQGVKKGGGERKGKTQKDVGDPLRGRKTREKRLNAIRPQSRKLFRKRHKVLVKGNFKAVGKLG